MKIRLNNEPRQIDEGTTIGTLIDQLELKPQFVAVELNKELIPREKHDAHVLAENDSVEIVTLVGGG